MKRRITLSTSYEEKKINKNSSLKTITPAKLILSKKQDYLFRMKSAQYNEYLRVTISLCLPVF